MYAGECLFRKHAGIGGEAVIPIFLGKQVADRKIIAQHARAFLGCVNALGDGLHRCVALTDRGEDFQLNGSAQSGGALISVQRLKDDCRRRGLGMGCGRHADHYTGGWEKTLPYGRGSGKRAQPAPTPETCAVFQNRDRKGAFPQTKT